MNLLLNGGAEKFTQTYDAELLSRFDPLCLRLQLLLRRSQLRMSMRTTMGEIRMGDRTSNEHRQNILDIMMTRLWPQPFNARWNSVRRWLPHLPERLDV